MDFVEDFNSLTPDFFYIALCVLLAMTALACGIRRFVGPIAIASIYFYSAVLLMMGAGIEQVVQGLALILLYFVFLLIGANAPILRFTRNNSTVERKVASYRSLAWIALIVYIVFLQLLLANYAASWKIDKINWVIGAGALPYVLSLLNGVLISLAFMLLVVRSYILFLIVALALAFGGYIFGEKSVFINIAILVVVVVFQKPLRPTTLLFTGLIGAVFLFLTIVYSFGASEGDGGEALFAFLARVVASFDGTMIILKTHMYENYEMPHSFLYYVFDFILSKIYGVSPGVGQILAATNVYSYPVNGGPNDSLVNYFLLSGILGKVWVGIFVAFFAFLLGALDQAVKERRLNTYTIGLQLILIPLYFLMPTFFHATGTTFLLLSRYYIFLLPLIVVVYSVKWMVKDVKR